MSGRPVLDVALVEPEVLDAHADAGNARALERRAGWEGVDVRVHRVDGVRAWPAHVDAVLVGDGDDASLETAFERLRALAGPLADAHAAGVPFVAVGLGLHGLATGCETAEGRPVPGAGIFRGRSVRSAQRVSGEIAVHASTLVLGYENHALQYRRAPDEPPLGDVVAGTGSGDGTEGAWRGAALGTELHGPLLVNNPALAVALLDAMTRRRLDEPFRPASAAAQERVALDRGLRAELAKRTAARGPMGMRTRPVTVVDETATATWGAPAAG